MGSYIVMISKSCNNDFLTDGYIYTFILSFRAVDFIIAMYYTMFVLISFVNIFLWMHLKSKQRMT